MNIPVMILNFVRSFTEKKKNRNKYFIAEGNLESGRRNAAPHPLC